MGGECSAATGFHQGYQRRRPEKTVLHQVVSQHIETLWAEAEAKSEHGSGYPSYVKHEFERFIHCGQLPGGFTRLRCRHCGCERLVAFSCKSRALCPSCVARRMADVSCHLTEHVLPIAPYRQWTLTFPYALRLPLARDPKLLSLVLRDFTRVLFCWQRLQARRAGIKEPLVGSVTFLQFWGSLLQLTPHPHLWLPDGVFSKNEEGKLVFHRLPPPRDEDVQELLVRVAQRVLPRFDLEETVDEGEDDAITQGQAESLSLPGIDAGPGPVIPRRLCAELDGFTLHADLAIRANDRAGLKRALRYGLRPPLSQKRLSLTPDGKVRLSLRKPLRDGRTSLVFEPLVFLRRLAASIPHPRQNTLRFHGLFAPNARARPLLSALVELQQAPKPKLALPTLVPTDVNTTAAEPTSEPVPRVYRRPWAELLKTVFDHDGLECFNCHRRMVPVQTVKDPAVIQTILEYLGRPTALPRTSPARGPPSEMLDLDATEVDLDSIPWDV